MLQIVIPMAGNGQRFRDAGYVLPKPFLDLNGVPMIVRVKDNLTPIEPHRFIFLARLEQQELVEKYLSFGSVVYVDKLTEGAASTVLLASHLIDNEEPLVIANSDQLVKWNNSAMACYAGGCYWRETNTFQDFVNASKVYDGAIATFKASHPKWSYARIDPNSEEIIEVAEKKVISDNATVGVYYYRAGSLFCDSARKMMKKNIRTNGEFYVCPAFNEMIEGYCTVVPYEVSKMYPLGTPEDFEATKCLI